MQNPSPGFSLIELMIVVAIISILTMLAIPSYQHYVMRARFTEVMTATLPYKTAVAIALQTGTSITELVNGTHWIPLETKPTKNLARVTVKKGVITAIGTALTNQATYILTPNADGSTWTMDGTCKQLELCHD